MVKNKFSLTHKSIFHSWCLWKVLSYLWKISSTPIDHVLVIFNKAEGRVGFIWHSADTDLLLQMAEQGQRRAHHTIKWDWQRQHYLGCDFPFLWTGCNIINRLFLSLRISKTFKPTTSYLSRMTHNDISNFWKIKKNCLWCCKVSIVLHDKMTLFPSVHNKRETLLKRIVKTRRKP